MKRFEVIHNIPSPYRLHLFRVISRQLEARGVAFRVHFMARSHDDRPKGWASAGGDIGFQHVFHDDRGFRLGGRSVHWNPSILGMLRAARPDWLLVGGPWDSLTGAVASFATPRMRSIAWFEANTQTPGRMGFPSGNFKRALLRRYQAYAVPGSDGAAYVKLLFGGREPPADMVVLPNIIDESSFQNPTPDAVKEGRTFFRSIGIPDENRVAIWPARLAEAKGIPPMLRALSKASPVGWSVVLIGEGPLRDQVQALISELRLGESVRVVPYVNYPSMPGLYRASSLFLLPSLHDPNPLSVVEALYSGLAVLVSRRIGNFAEALREGVNGWSLDPADPEAALRQTMRAFSTDSATLREMGTRSAALARASWDSETEVSRFLDVALGSSQAR